MEAAPKRVLTPALPKEIISSEGGRYQVWLSSSLSMLSEARIGAAKLILNHLGLSLPKYSDSSKVCYVLRGSGIGGILLPEAQLERVVKVKRGDAIAVPFGAVSWWFNDNPSEELEILFLGDTSKAHRSGEFTDFHLTGCSNGLFHGFSKEFMCRAWDLKESEINHILSSQSGSGIVKLKEGTSMPAPEAKAGDKHVETHCHFIRKLVEDGSVQLLYVPTEDQTADILTKLLSTDKFVKFRGHLGVVDRLSIKGGY